MEYLLHIQISVDMVEIWISVEGKKGKEIILMDYLLQIYISMYMLVLTS